ncbi:MAG: 3,5-cyclic-nucleotide phosphodiesterase [Herbaspirillum sp.]|jgi:ribonuclease BN (tRNA processing enzyme)|nr:3,5-cyclic-nucleotide phosphodiesterase [Herbaspirillum sp.]
MKVRILGCSGGIGGNGLRTTCLAVDDDILIDAGTGAADLSLQALTRVDHVFITHSHLDHVACLPFILDSVGELRSRPLIMYATQSTQDIIREHIFNWKIWPDFSTIPTPEQPFLRFATIAVGVPTVIGGRSITALPADHTVPAVGYLLDSGNGSLAFSGDTGVCDDLWKTLNAVGNLRHLIIEAAFPDEERALAQLSKHLCPSLLLEELDKLMRDTDISVTHAKPGQFERIRQQIADGVAARSFRHRPAMLRQDQLFEF